MSATFGTPLFLLLALTSQLAQSQWQIPLLVPTPLRFPSMLQPPVQSDGKCSDLDTSFLTRLHDDLVAHMGSRMPEPPSNASDFSPNELVCMEKGMMPARLCALPKPDQTSGVEKAGNGEIEGFKRALKKLFCGPVPL